MQLLTDLVAFAVKGLVVTLALAAVAVVIAVLVRRTRLGGAGPRLEVQSLNERFEALSAALRAEVMEPKAFRQWVKEVKAERKKPQTGATTVYVLDFDGDLLATAAQSLREEVTAILSLGQPGDEVVVRLESPGGAVPHYGLAAAQLARLKSHKLTLTVCVDRIAASGGYMMACVADAIVAAPFAIVGSIGVVAQVPNAHRLLKRFDVDYDEMTAGEFKRTVSVFGEITPQGRQKFQEQLEETHGLFKDFVKAQRPKLNIDSVATGEYWHGTKSLELGLVDRLATSDEYLLEKAETAKVVRVKYVREHAWRDRLTQFTGDVVDNAIDGVMRRVGAGLRG